MIEFVEGIPPVKKGTHTIPAFKLIAQTKKSRSSC